MRQRKHAEGKKVNYLYKPSIYLTKEKERKGQTHETQQRIYGKILRNIFR
jgi:hypothetical protein